MSANLFECVLMQLSGNKGGLINVFLTAHPRNLCFIFGEWKSKILFICYFHAIVQLWTLLPPIKTKNKNKVAMAKMLMLMHQKDNTTNQKVTSLWLHPCLIGCSTFAWCFELFNKLHDGTISKWPSFCFLFWLCSAIKIATYQKTHTHQSFY